MAHPVVLATGRTNGIIMLLVFSGCKRFTTKYAEHLFLVTPKKRAVYLWEWLSKLEGSDNQNSCRRHQEMKYIAYVVMQFHKIVGHEGPLIPSEPSNSESRCNVHMEWEDGELTI